MTEKLVFQPKNSWESKNNYSAFYSGPVSEPINNVIKDFVGMHGCRDGLGSSVRQSIMNETMATDKTRWLFMWIHPSSCEDKKARTAEDMEWGQRGVEVLHAVEKLAGWPLTKPSFEVEMPRGYMSGMYCYSSRRWLKSPYLMTLYILLVRMCADVRITGFKNYDDLVKLLGNLTSSGNHLKRDTDYVRNTFSFWRALMVGYPKLFRKRKITYYWDTARLQQRRNDYEGYGEGIARLCSGNTEYKEVYQKLIEIKKDLEGKNKK